MIIYLCLKKPQALFGLYPVKETNTFIGGLVTNMLLPKRVLHASFQPVSTSLTEVDHGDKNKKGFILFIINVVQLQRLTLKHSANQHHHFTPRTHSQKECKW